MAKNAPNELKFGPDMYFYEFPFQKIFGKFSKLVDFWQSFSTFFAQRFQNFFFDGKRNRAFKNAQIWLKICILVAYYVFNKTMHRFWMILNFSNFMSLQNFRGGYFLSFLVIFSPFCLKCTLSTTQTSHESTKTQNHPIPMYSSV